MFDAAITERIGILSQPLNHPQRFKNVKFTAYLNRIIKNWYGETEWETYKWVQIINIVFV